MKYPLCVLSLFTATAFGLDNAVIKDAERALAEGIPQVTIAKLESALQQKTIAEKERHSAMRVLAEAQLEAGRTAEALATLKQVPAVRQDLLLRANANVRAGNWDEALTHYKALLAGDDAPPAAALGAAECLQALGRIAEAVTALRELVVSGSAPISAHLRLASLYIEASRPDDARKVLSPLQLTNSPDIKWRQLMEARIHLLENNPKAALLVLEELRRDNTGLSENLVTAATLATAEARLALSGTDAAEKELESYIRRNPGNSQLALIFRRLDQIYATDRNPAEGVLHGFFSDLPPQAAALAQFYVAKMQFRAERFDRAQKSLEIFLKKFPLHEMVPYAYQMQAKLHTRAKDLEAADRSYDQAIKAAKTPDFRAELALEAALVEMLQGEFAQAATRLGEAKSSPHLKQSVAYNSALSWLMQQNYARFREELTAFAAQFQTPLLIGQLRLEEGLVRARNKDNSAAATLEGFLGEFPEHPRKAEAQIALAELAYLKGGVNEASALLTQAREIRANPETAEQSDYLAVFLADKREPRNPDEVIRLARHFIHTHANSPLVSDVRMKLGQVYFAGDDYLKAQEQFETLATANPTGTFAEMALFLAGQCGMKRINTEALNHALELFDKVAERKGPLELRARLQQALIKKKLGAEEDAVKIYDNIISASPGDHQVRYAALIGKGDNLVVTAQAIAGAEATSPTAAQRERALNEAIQAYDLILADSQCGATWRNQAAYKKGKALQQLGHTDRALAVFYDVLEKNAAPDRESFWFAKSGFDAAALLESGEQWKNAIAVYEKMARVPGPHVAQVRQRIKTLRLEKYLWD